MTGGRWNMVLWNNNHQINVWNRCKNGNKDESNLEILFTTIDPRIQDYNTTMQPQILPSILKSTCYQCSPSQNIQPEVCMELHRHFVCIIKGWHIFHKYQEYVYALKLYCATKALSLTTKLQQFLFLTVYTRINGEPHLPLYNNYCTDAAYYTIKLCFCLRIYWTLVNRSGPTCVRMRSELMLLHCIIRNRLYSLTSHIPRIYLARTSLRYVLIPQKDWVIQESKTNPWKIQDICSTDSKPRPSE